MSEATSGKESGKPLRGLGRGLSALLGESEILSGAAPGAGPNGVEVGIDLIDRNPQQPRKDFDPALLQALCESIRQHGVLQPLLLRPAAAGDGRYQIVAGERRWRAAQMAGLSTVPALVRAFDDLSTLEVSIVENVQRADLNAVEEALAFQQLIDRFGRTQQSVADAVGKSRAHIANTLRLLSLPEEVLELIRDGKISAGHGRAALGASDPVAFAQMIAERGLSVRDAERLAASRAGQNEAKKKRSDVSRETHSDADSKALAADLSAALGLEVSLTHVGKHGGTLSINYRTLEQLDDLCRRLMQHHRH
jgi:ParB family transcriptional regulator, chromosome partitioning protein